eukprot:TRINITY_DN6542_c0_g1_i1.p1 TRINITY_DN6542_c0_g1~~TRINITY_DN6542_c0_g1_i1.p1  ORF type:complete len:266 (-),score=15.60 TRINITY_DN6542_c0_g1_i1:25-822(-)
MVKLHFRVNFWTQFGENIYVSGADPLLGCWKQHDAKKLQWVGDGNWELIIEAPHQEWDLGRGELRYKYFMKNHNKPNHVPFVEPGTARVRHIRDLVDGKCFDQWGEGPKVQKLPLNNLGLYRGPMPHSGFDPTKTVFDELRQHGIRTIVPLCHEWECTKWAKREVFQDYRKEGYELLHYAIHDFNVPEDMPSWDRFLELIHSKLISGERIYVHCHAGIGRTGLLAACIAKKYCGMSSQEAIEWIRNEVPGALQTQVQEKFVQDYR